MCLTGSGRLDLDRASGEADPDLRVVEVGTRDQQPRQRRDDRRLDRPLERPRAKERVEAGAGEMRDDVVSEDEPEPRAGQPLAARQLVELLPGDRLDGVL